MQQEKLEVDYDFVYIIDCLSDEEKVVHELTSQLQETLKAHGIKSAVANCGNSKGLLEALDYAAKIARSGLRFCIHIVSHGSTEGLLLKHQTQLVQWSVIKSKLLVINQALGNTLLINMSTCKGLHGAKMVDDESDVFPFYGLIGCHRDLYIYEAKIINRSFYEKMISGKDVSLITAEIQAEFIEAGSKDSVLYCISSKGFQNLKRDGIPESY